MKHYLFLLLTSYLLLSSGSASANHTLWYTQPAGGEGDVWMEQSLPIGNGQLGASLFGGVAQDVILFNEKTLWTGSNGVSSDRRPYGDGVVYGAYMPFGCLFVETLNSAGKAVSNKANDYLRTLDLETGIGTVRYTDPDTGIAYSREYFVSYPDNAIIVHYKVDRPGELNLCVTMESAKPALACTTVYGYNYGAFEGKLNTVSYKADFRVTPVGGKAYTGRRGIVVEGATEATVVLKAATDFDAYSPNYVGRTYNLSPDNAAATYALSLRDYAELRARHLEDFTRYMGRVKFNLGGTNDKPTDQLVDEYFDADPTLPSSLMLEELYFYFGRYLEISSSRGVNLPSNLQGIWNSSTKPAWQCDIHSNINVQMNYWPAEPGNMSEMHEPFLNYIWNEAVNHPEWTANAREWAKQDRGWTLFTENNIFGGGSTFATNYVIANAWYCTHLWQHYRYTLDKTFLKDKALPAMWTACLFWLDRLVLASDGTYECPAEYSPEHGPKEENGVAHAQQLVVDLFGNTLKALDIVGKDAYMSDTDIADLRNKYAKLDRGLALETYDGKWGTDVVPAGAKLLREWKYSNYSAGENHHRHQSHLMCLYPFNQLTPKDGELFEAALNTMRLRGDVSTGWSMGWKINLWARALDGNRAHAVLHNALRRSTTVKREGAWNGGGIYPNLYDTHPPFQIDGNFGACAGMMEMCLQSQNDVLQLLPALPAVWKNGEMKGLKAVGGYTVDQAWKNGKLTEAVVTAAHDGVCRIQYPTIADYEVSVNGKTAKGSVEGDELHLSVKANDVISIRKK